MSYNKIILGGRLTADPELRYAKGDIPVTTFTLAVDRDYKNPDGSYTTDFIDVTCWRKNAEFVAKYFSKGRKMLVEGSLWIDKYTDKEGIKRSKAIVQSVKKIDFCDSAKREEQEDNSTPDYQSAPQQAAPTQNYNRAADIAPMQQYNAADQSMLGVNQAFSDDDDLPF